MVVAPANRHDMKLFEATLEAQGLVPPDLEDGDLRHLCLDRGYDYEEVREILDAWDYEALGSLIFIEGSEIQVQGRSKWILASSARPESSSGGA
jgi:hypothetical protein